MSEHLSHFLGRTCKRSELIAQLVRIEKAMLYSSTKRHLLSRQNLLHHATILVDDMARLDR